MGTATRGMATGRLIGVGVLMAGVLTMAGCGDDNVNPSAATPTRAGSTGTPSPDESPSSIAPSDLEGRAKALFISAEDLGPSWRLSQPPQPGFGLTVCGVDIEPEDPIGSTRQRLAQSAVGPFLAQHVQAHRDGLATEVVDRLRAALPGCSRFETKGESAASPVTSFVIDPVDFAAVPGDAVVWRMTSQGDRAVTQDVALVARGEFLVGFVSYAAGNPPDPTVITTAVAALPTTP